MSTKAINEFYEYLAGRTPMEAMKEELESPEFSNHCSDLYVRATPEVTAWLRKRNLVGTVNCTGFMSNDGTGAWYDLPFMYHEYHKS